MVCLERALADFYALTLQMRSDLRERPPGASSRLDLSVEVVNHLSDRRRPTRLRVCEVDQAAFERFYAGRLGCHCRHPG
jgi:hypothetical protein